MEAAKGFVEKFGSNFLVASVVPSILFVSSFFLIFLPIVLEEPIELLQNSDFSLLGQFGLYVFFISLVIGFTLTSLNTFIIKAFEGYVFIWRFKFLNKQEKKKALRLQKKINGVKKRKDRLIGTKSPRKLKKWQRLRDIEYQLRVEYDQNFPPDLSDVLPTRFGNILQAAEAYPGSRYGIASVPIWSRLIYVIPKDYYDKLSEGHNELSFLINCSVLSLMMALFAISMITLKTLLFWIPYNVPYDIPIGDKVNYLAFFFIAFLSFFCAYLFYKAAVQIVSYYGDMIRTAFDLFRFDLLKQLNQELPENSNDEYDNWRILSDFIASGKHLRPHHEFKYIFHTCEETTELGSD